MRRARRCRWPRCGNTASTDARSSTARCSTRKRSSATTAPTGPRTSTGSSAGRQRATGAKTTTRSTRAAAASSRCCRRASAASPCGRPTCGPRTTGVSGQHPNPSPQNKNLTSHPYAGIHLQTASDSPPRGADLRRHQPLRQPDACPGGPRRGVAGHRGALLVQGQGLHREAPHGGAHRPQAREDRGRRGRRPDGLRLLDPAAQGLRHGHAPAGGAAHRPEHDDADDDRLEAARGRRPDRRRHRPGDERRPAVLIRHPARPVTPRTEHKKATRTN